ncbi:HEAT repeat domain-containing protein [Actinoplanes bogorensis]|uniref:HEAT repeat domain-containing protein n=1 Tax=Paractinoplanes bogorensis TaxID=1610840 RepID=A0ABS5YH71_9ACTN|nr:HEAT repeat domain-containing protein [Actinoplanes bogorensis]MBU2662747.1 HEAT repeat domain-containing protein [Actinoplanes bogorensis]
MTASPLLDEAARRGGEALDAVLVALGRSSAAPTSPASPISPALPTDVVSPFPLVTLVSLIERPRLVTQLDDRFRGHTWWERADSLIGLDRPSSGSGPGLMERLRRSFGHERQMASSHRDERARDLAVPASLHRGGLGHELLALASMHRDGRVREQAVLAMAARPAPGVMPFLVLRSGDWVGPVREPARVAVAALLAEQPEVYLPAAVPIAAHTAGRMRGGWAMEQVRAATAANFDRVAPLLMASPRPAPRRLAFGVGEQLDRWTSAELLHFALHEGDVVIRSRATEAAVRHADTADLRRMAASRFSGVRIAALVKMAFSGLDADVAAAADDPAPLVRAYARTRIADPLSHYRAAVTAHPTPGLVAGLGEVGRYDDEALLTPLLSHPDPRIRAAAVRALVAIDAVRVERFLPLLQDPAAGVIREAARALRPFERRVPADLLSRLFDDPRPEVRRGARRILGSRAAG